MIIKYLQKVNVHHTSMVYRKNPPNFATILDLNQDKEPINQELSKILAKYYDGSFARLVQEFLRISGITEEKKALVEAVKNYQLSKIERS